MCSVIFSKDVDVKFHPSSNGFSFQWFSLYIVNQDGSDGGGLDLIFLDKPVVNKVAGCSTVNKRRCIGCPIFSYEIYLNPKWWCL